MQGSSSGSLCRCGVGVSQEGVGLVTSVEAVGKLPVYAPFEIPQGLAVLSGRHGPIRDAESGVLLLPPSRFSILHCSSYFFLHTQWISVLSEHDASVDRA